MGRNAKMTRIEYIESCAALRARKARIKWLKKFIKPLIYLEKTTASGVMTKNSVSVAVLTCQFRSLLESEINRLEYHVRLERS